MLSRMSENEAVTYVKGDSVKYARTPDQKAQLWFAGYRPAEEVVGGEEGSGLSHAELKAQAKALGIPANQSKDKLADAIANHVPSAETVEATT